MIDDRREPTGPLPEDPAAGADAAAVRGPFERFPPPQPASTAWRLAAAFAFIAYAAPQLAMALGNHASPVEWASRLLGVAVLPLLTVGISAFWDGNRTQKTRVKVFCITCAVCALATGLSFASKRGYGSRWPGSDATPPSAVELRERAARCMASRDLACAEDSWAGYVRLRPLDGQGIANLGIVMNLRDEHAEAVVQFQKAIDAGEGAYDLFAYYADSLAKLGRVDDAIDWSYRSLAVRPTLVDVRGSLATLLVNRQRQHEALALLQAHDADLQARGRPAVFAGQRIAIENSLQGGSPQASPERSALRLPSHGEHYYAPVAFGTAHSAPFMVDTGASRTTLSRELLSASKVDYQVVQAAVEMTTADGRKVRADLVTLDSLKLGPFELKNAPALVCDGCASLLGQSTLSHFDMQTSRVQGVDFLLLTRRAGG